MSADYLSRYSLYPKTDISKQADVTPPKNLSICNECLNFYINNSINDNSRYASFRKLKCISCKTTEERSQMYTYKKDVDSRYFFRNPLKTSPYFLRFCSDCLDKMNIYR